MHQVIKFRTKCENSHQMKQWNGKLKLTDLAVNTMIRVNKNLIENKMLFTCQACH